MANKRINELALRTPQTTDLMLIGDPTTGYSYKNTLGAITANLVPYSGATSNLNLGEFGISSGFISFDTTPTGTPTGQGTMYWDDASKTVALIMNGTTQKIGLDQFYMVKNSTGATIAKGTAVGFAGTDGNSGHLLIKKFQANGSEPSQYYMGITSEEIVNGGFGKVMRFGRLDGVNTSAFADGNILYVSTSVAGGFQASVPVAPNNIIVAAAVVSAGNNGKLIVRETLGSNINNDEGVKITTPTNGQVLRYNSTTSLWENSNEQSLSGYVQGSGVAGQVAYWNGTNSQTGSNNLFWDATNNRLGIGTSSPNAPLEVFATGIGSYGAIGIRGTSAFIGFRTAADAFKGWIGYFDSGTHGSDINLNIVTGYNVLSNIVFKTNGDTGEAMRITSSGRILMGTSTDNLTDLLQVAGSAAINGSVLLSSGYKLFGNATSGSTSSYISLYNATDGGIDLMANFSTSKITFGTAGTERFRIGSSGDLTFSNVPTSASASSVANYLSVTVNGTAYLIPLHNLP